MKKATPKRKKPPRTHPYQLKIWVSKSERERLKSRAAAHGELLSRLIRRLIGLEN